MYFLAVHFRGYIFSQGGEHNSGSLRAPSLCLFIERKIKTFREVGTLCLSDSVFKRPAFCARNVHLLESNDFHECVGRSTSLEANDHPSSSSDNEI